MQLEVSDLVFSYGEADVLKSVSFCADRGERIAVLGPNGVGKSTLFRCLLGFLEPKRGSVKIAGRDVRDYSRRALAAELAYIPQSYSPAFDHTVLDSVLMGLGAQLGPFDRPSREQTNAAQRILDELGIGALASRGCMRISGGERQRLSIARAFLKNAPVILLDESTASIDPENETKIQQAIGRLIQNKTVLIIAHKLRTVAGCDKIVVLDSGSVAEEGTHETLMEQKGLYYKLYTLQSESLVWKVRAQIRRYLHEHKR